MLFPKGTDDYLRKRKDVFSPLPDIYAGQERRAIRQAKAVAAAWVHAESILDIGCGLGCVDAILARDYGVGTVHLMDGDGTGMTRHDYGADVAPWCDVNLAVDVVRLNAPKTIVHAHLADPAITIPVDVIISLKSWGTHYPVSTYLPLARRSLVEGGLLMLDMRYGYDDSDEVRAAGFRLVSSPTPRRRVFVRYTANVHQNAVGK